MEGGLSIGYKIKNPKFKLPTFKYEISCWRPENNFRVLYLSSSIIMFLTLSPSHNAVQYIIIIIIINLLRLTFGILKILRRCLKKCIRALKFLNCTQNYYYEKYINYKKSLKFKTHVYV